MVICGKEQFSEGNIDFNVVKIFKVSVGSVYVGQFGRNYMLLLYVIWDLVVNVDCV